VLLGYLADTHIRGEDHRHGSEAIAEALTGMKREGVSRVLCAGDVFDAPSILDKHAMTGTLVRAFLGPVEEYGIPWTLVEGNHDQAPASEKGALAAISASPLCTVVSGDLSLTQLAKNVKVAFLPWLDKSYALLGVPPEERKNHQEIFRHYCMERVQRITEFFQDDSDTRVLLGHLEVIGAVGGAYRYVIPGSTFWFQCQDLLDTAADVIALGHVHYRQRLNLSDDRQWLGYIGGIRHLNYGERENPVGWMLHDTDTGRLSFFDTKKAPRYFVISTDDIAKPSVVGGIRNEDHVRVTGLTRPEGIPSSWDFVSTRVSSRQQINPRASTISPGDSITDLLSAWLRESGNADLLDDIIPYADKVSSSLEATESSSSGGLEEIIRISLNGIDRHHATELDTEGENRIAILGQNGSGKSTLIGAVYACFFGDWPTEGRGSVYEMMTGDTAQLEVVFRADGITYRAQRRLEKSGRKTEPPVALLSMLVDGEEVPVAGPKVRAFEAKIEQIIGYKDIVLGSVFYTQDGAGDLVTSKKGARKDWIRKFLGLTRYDPCAKYAYEQAKVAEKVILRNENMVGKIPALGNELARLCDLRISLQARMEAIEHKIAELEAYNVKLREALDRSSLANQEYSRLCANRKSIEDEIASIRAQIVKLELTISSYASKIPEDYETVSVEELRQLASSLRKKVEEAQTENDKYDRITCALTKLKAERNALLQRVKDHRKQASLLDSVGCRENPLPCPLIANAIASKDAIPTMLSRLEELEGSIKKYSSISPPSPYSAVAAEWQKAEDKVSKYAAVAGYAEGMLKTRQELEEKRVSMLQHEMALEDVNDLIRNTKKVDDAPIRERLDKITRALSTLRETEYYSARDKCAMASTEIAILEKQIEEAKQAELLLAYAHKDKDAYTLLSRAFGRDGIPQLLISNAIPEIQHYIDSICTEDFDSRYRVRINTQKEHKNGVVEEAFEILFSSASGDKEYDAASCSGGELAAVRVIVRAALGLYHASRARGHKVAFLDEFTAHQDPQNAESSLRVLSRLEDRFSQIFFVTFDHTLLPGFPFRVILNGTGAPKCINTNDG
jgi:DNA repair exonuclease SbcCD ATPase subunit/DNA repair exonuclease SbcCD nuclease subunit